MKRRGVCQVVMVAASMALTCRAALSQERPVDPVRVLGGDVEIAPVSRMFIDRLFDSLRAQAAFSVEPLMGSPVADAGAAIIWAGTKTDIQTTLSEIVLRFRPSAEARLERAARPAKQPLSMLAEEFEVKLVWDREGLHITHPLAESKEFRAGVVSPVEMLRRNPARIQYVRGGREAGMYLSIPSMVLSEVEQAWGVLICPRVVTLAEAKHGSRASVELRHSPYELSEVKMTWAGKAWASMPFGSKKERLAIDLSLSKELPRSASVRDEVVGMSPALTVAYQPVSDFEFTRYPQDGQLRQGLVFSVTMQNSAGHARVQHFARVGYVQRIDEPSPVSVIIGDQVASRDEGTCYVVGSQRGVSAEYSKGAPMQ